MKRLIIIITVLAAMTAAKAQEYYVPQRIIAEKNTVYQLRTNGIYDLALIPNIGLEVQLESGYAIQLDYIGTWLNSRSSAKYYSCYGLQGEVRYYPDSKWHFPPYNGQHYGVYVQTMTYDFEFGGKGYQSAKFGSTWALGVSYGYTFTLNSSLSLDITGGIGFFHSSYDKYTPYYEYESLKGFVRTAKGSLNIPMVTKLECSLVWHINGRNE